VTDETPSAAIARVSDPAFEATLVTMARRKPGGLSPKERGELTRTLHTRIGPMMAAAFKAASEGYLEWDDDRWEVCLEWVTGPLQREILYGACKDCGHTLEHHRNDSGGKPCDGGGGTCGHSPFKPSVSKGQREKLFPLFEILGKGKDTGQLDNPFAKALVFAFASTFRNTLDNALDWMGVKKLEHEPVDGQVLNEVGLPALPPGS
jgi:hypothetical protein